MPSCNEEKCPCPEITCERHGKCCLCISHHLDRNSLVNCMKEIAKSANS